MVTAVCQQLDDKAGDEKSERKIVLYVLLLPPAK
jgi:hypothetical protein